MPLDKKIDLKKLARQLEGYSGADIDAIVREAGMHAIRLILKSKRKEKIVLKEDFEVAINKVKPSLAGITLKKYSDALDKQPVLDYMG